ncbi:MAG: hypothetical protein DDT42_00055 [candidate division WS2 bacterium]|uniref:Uncharacterized protein n=1 Tax=Psychracetigena formicireducens TaxID=2986056 RepID=A0A9E2F648_PSYF1|nr:hypothetical protein [Candidatus Psychracetigena formicireducens]MBT9144223.1 hypothetical protein [Candidatus Psychracetigena formicireducens]
MAKVKKTRKIRITTILLLTVLLVLVWGVTTYRQEIEDTLLNFFLRFYITEYEGIVDHRVPQLIETEISNQVDEILQTRRDGTEIVVIGEDTRKVNIFAP